MRLTEGEVDTTGLRKAASVHIDQAKNLGASLDRLLDRPGELGERARALRQRIKKVETRVREHRARISEVETVSIDFGTRYRRCEQRLERLPEGPYKTGSQKRRLADWVDDMVVTLEICEKHAVKFQENSPSMLVEDSSAINAEIGRLRAESRQIVELTTPQEPDAAAGDGTKGAGAARRQGKAGTSAGTSSGTAGAQTAVVSVVPSDATEGDAAKTARSPKTPSPSTEEGEDEGASSSSPLFYGFLSALAGFGLATVVFVALGRNRRRPRRV